MPTATTRPAATPRRELIDGGCHLEMCPFRPTMREVLPPDELIAEYKAKRAEIGQNIDQNLAELQHLLGLKTEVMKKNNLRISILQQSH